MSKIYINGEDCSGSLQIDQVVNGLSNHAVSNKAVYDAIQASGGGGGGSGDTKLNVDGSNATDAGITTMLNKLEGNSSTPTDDTLIVYENEEGKFARHSFARIWVYIESKINSALGLTSTSYNGKAATADNLTPGGTAGQVLTSNGESAPEWKNAPVMTLDGDVLTITL